MTEACLRSLREGRSLGSILEVLPEGGAWTEQALGCAHEALAALRVADPGAAEVVAALLPSPVVPPPRPPASDESADEQSDEEPMDEGAYGAVPPTGATALATQLEQDRNMARAEAAAKVARIAARQHIAKFAARYFRKTESVDKEDGTQCAAWMPCAALAEVQGLRAGSKLAGNGTHFKSTVMDTEHMARFIAANHAWLDANAVATEDIPLRVAREGSWATADALVTDLREARRAVLRYVAELEAVIAHLRNVFQTLDTAHASGGAEAVLSVIKVMDKRKRGRNDRLKLPYRKLTEEDQAFARDMLPGHGDAVMDGRRVLSVLHGLRILVWRHTDEPFPGALVLNCPSVLNSRVKWKGGKERGLAAAQRIIADLERCMLTPPTLWVCHQPPLAGAARLAAVAMQRERAAVPPVTAWRQMSPILLLTEPRSLALEPFCDPAPTQLAGKFTARPNRYPCSVAVNPPAVFELSSGPRSGPLLPRQQGLVVHDSVGQWVHAPGYVTVHQI